MQVLRASLMMVAGIVLPWLLQLADRRRLTPNARARGWNIASWGSALYAFGPLSMLGWCWTTRPPWIRCVVGALYTPLALGALVLFDGLIGWLSGTTALSELPNAAVEFVSVLGIASAGSFLFLLVLEAFATLRRAVI